jgi:4-amino-4-deoxy-L-arabinose transferase-like glycosyltransferase
MKLHKPDSPARVPRSLPPARPTRRELLLVSGVLLTGFVLRLIALLHSAVEHFDEGVYASNIYFGPPDYAYPLQRFYAPPLLPALIEAGMIADLPPNVAALLPSFVAGCSTIVALWWFGRSWFGPPVGLSAATFAALSDFHVTYSTAALTDALLCLWLVLALDAIGRSLFADDLRWAVAAGLYTGAAWWTKYNGWLPLVIEAAAVPLMWLVLRPPRKQLLAWLACIALTALIAAAVWSPYYLSLQSHGGYRPIAANHAKYVVGFVGWFDSAARQIANQYVIEGLWSKLAVVAALVLPDFLVPRRFRDGLPMLRTGVLAGLLALLLTSFVVAGVAAAIGLARFWRTLDRTRSTNTCQRPAIVTLIVAAWWTGLLLATPLYTSYPRLVLPWQMAAWIGAALNCAAPLAARDPLPQSEWKLGRRGWLVLSVVALCLVIVLPRVVPHDEQLTLEGDRQGLLSVARQVRQTEVKGETRVIYVYGEPALYFQLRAGGEPIVMPIQDVPSQAATLEEKAIATYLIVGPHSRSDPQFHQQWAKTESQWELVSTFDYVPSAIVRLDLHDPRSAAQESPTAKFRVYRFRL